MMKITELMIKDFRNIVEAALNFVQVNKIVGDNGEGKSTIMEAIIYVLTGLTKSGSTHCDDLIRNGADKAEVTCVFTNDLGESHTVCRRKSTKSITIKLDGKVCKQEAVESAMGATAQVFLAAFNPAYLLSVAEQDQSKARQLVVSLVEQPTPEEVLNMLPEGKRAVLTGEDLLNPETGLKNSRKKATALGEDKLKLQGKIEAVKSQLQGMSDIGENALQVLAELQIKLDQTKKELVAVNMPERPPKPELGDETRLKYKYDTLIADYKDLAAKKKALEAAQPKPGQKCPYCTSVMPRLSLEDALNKWSGEINVLENRISGVTEDGKRCRTEMEKTVAANKQALKDYQDALAKWEMQTADARAHKDRITAALDTLQQQVTEQTVLASKIKEKRSVQTQLNVLTKELAGVEQGIARFEAVSDALLSYQESLTELVSNRLSHGLDKVSLKLFDFAKTTGEIKPMFKLLYDGKPSAFLSFSERTRVGTELARLINAVKQLNLPVFIDNAESITGLGTVVNSGQQVFLARVVPGAVLSINQPPAMQIKEAV